MDGRFAAAQQAAFPVIHGYSGDPPDLRFSSRISTVSLKWNGVNRERCVSISEMQRVDQSRLFCFFFDITLALLTIDLVAISDGYCRVLLSMSFYEETIAVFRTAAAAFTRLFTPSARRTAETWAFTVL